MNYTYTEINKQMMSNFDQIFNDLKIAKEDLAEQGKHMKELTNRISELYLENENLKQEIQILLVEKDVQTSINERLTEIIIKAIKEKP